MGFIRYFTAIDMHMYARKQRKTSVQILSYLIKPSMQLSTFVKPNLDMNHYVYMNILIIKN